MVIKKLALIRIFLFFSIFFLLTNGICISGELFNYGIPYIKHFTKKEYKAGNKNWSLTQDTNGFIYIGNSNGLLQYDGIRWKKFNSPGSTIIRSVLADDERIYCGSLGEFGYWEKDEQLNLHYTSISKLVKNQEFEQEEIWWITKFKKKIIFQSFGNTFAYDGKTVEKVLSGVGVIFPPFIVNDRLFIPVLNEGIYEIKDGDVQFLPGSEIFIDKRINVMLSFSDDDRVLVGTENDGFFTFFGSKFKPWPLSDGKTISSQQINRGIKMPGKIFAIGTILGGVFILNEDGEILNQINREKGLNNNTVLSLMVDKKNNLWVGLDNGIDLIKVNSPLYYNTDPSGNIGSVYTSAIYEGILYLGTNRGVYYKKLNKNSGFADSKFSLIQGSQGQVWNLSVIDNTLFCGHNVFTCIIKGNQLRKISDISGGYVFRHYPYNDNYIFQGGYAGLTVYKKEKGRWVFSNKIDGFSKLSKIIEFERENVVWVSHPHRGLHRLELNDKLEEVVETRNFSTRTKTYINKLNNKLVFSSDSGFVYYDDIQNSFFSLEELNGALGDFSKNAHMISAEKDNYWIFKDVDCAKAVLDEKSVKNLDDNILNDLGGYLIPGHENIYVIDSSYNLIYLDNGLAIYDNNWTDNSLGYKPKLLLRDIYFTDINSEKFQSKEGDTKIPYRFNNVNISISFPEYAKEIDLLYKLKGYDDRWIKAQNQEDIIFKNLPFGEYTFLALPEYDFQDHELSIDFTIKPPWYISNLALAIYVFFIILVLLSSVFLYKRKIRIIDERHKQKRNRMLEKEIAENEKKMIEIRNEHLRNEIKLRNKRLAKSTFSLIHKNNTLISVKDELTKIKEGLGVRFPSKHFNRLIKNIDSDMTSENDWIMFEQSFSEVHENFIQKLKEEYTQLTPGDLQLCAYLKMNLSSKEIATLLNITIRGVEIRRYRLRKNLQLEHDKNLVEFIMGY